MQKKLLALIIAGILMLTACGGSTPAETTAATTTAETTTSETTTAEMTTAETTTAETTTSETTTAEMTTAETTTAETTTAETTTVETTTAETTTADTTTVAETTTIAETTTAAETTSAAEKVWVTQKIRDLSNPNATETTKEVYKWLCETYTHNIISGQQESTWKGSPDYEMDYVFETSGKYPALRGLDYMHMDFDGVNERAKEWWAKGGLVTICWHCGPDFHGEWTNSQKEEIADWDKALTEGTDEYNTLIEGMDMGAKALLELQEAGVPVLWRPFHEFDGAWFWWGKGGAENFKKLWKLMYDRYTNYWGLNNLIWVYGYSHKVSDGWYVGDEYVDIVGADNYSTGTQGNRFKRISTYLTDNSIPLVYHENGTMPPPDKLVEDNIYWLWFMTWHTEHIIDEKFNTKDFINEVYNNDYVLTLEDIPSFGR